MARELGRVHAGLCDSSPQMRSSTSPRAWSAPSKVEELSYTVLPALVCLSASPSRKAYPGKIWELSEMGLPVPPRRENRHSLTSCQFVFLPIKRKGCLRTPENCYVIHQCLSPEAGGQSWSPLARVVVLVRPGNLGHTLVSVRTTKSLTGLGAVLPRTAGQRN